MRRRRKKPERRGRAANAGEFVVTRGATKRPGCLLLPGTPQGGPGRRPGKASWEGAFPGVCRRGGRGGPPCAVPSPRALPATSRGQSRAHAGRAEARGTPGGPASPSSHASGSRHGKRKGNRNRSVREREGAAGGAPGRTPRGPGPAAPCRRRMRLYIKTKTPALPPSGPHSGPFSWPVRLMVSVSNDVTPEHSQPCRKPY